LFSCPSTTSWGIGDIGDLAPLTAWMAEAGQRVLQLLPINEMADGQHSPYSAISAMAIDPLYIRVSRVPEFAALGGERSLGAGDRGALAGARQAFRIDYATVRRLKRAALRAAFERFHAVEWGRHSERARALESYVAAQDWWLADYALFCALHAREGHQPWTTWPPPLRHRDEEALDRARQELSHEVLFYEYLQWVAATQWKEARQIAERHGVGLFGDLAFMVDGDSADVWTRQTEFQLDASVGVPPDAFSAAGQDWGMPVYRWDAMSADGFGWLRARARRSADLYHGYRVDHLVGYYRTYARPHDGAPPFFTPEREADQIALGERILGLFREPGTEIVAEDLGTVPDFVRESLARLGVPGCRVFRWERLWDEEGRPFRDPTDYPPVSLATSGTHDTEPLAVWWEGVGAGERLLISALPSLQRLTGGATLEGAPYNPVVRDRLLEVLFGSASDLLVLPLPDVFGWRDRINEPATVGHQNWTFRLPWPCDRLGEVPAARERQAALGDWTLRYGRAAPGFAPRSRSV
jgi:4-alpha-glucanotransferase